MQYGKQHVMTNCVLGVFSAEGQSQKCRRLTKRKLFVCSLTPPHLIQIKLHLNELIATYKLQPCGSDVISELQHRSLCRRNETRTVNLEEQFEKSARAQSERTENPVGDTAGSVRRFFRSLALGFGGFFVLLFKIHGSRFIPPA